MTWFARLCVTVLLVTLSALVFKVAEHVFPELLHGEQAAVSDAWHAISVRTKPKQTEVDDGTTPALLDESLRNPAVTPAMAAPAAASASPDTAATASATASSAAAADTPASGASLKPLPLSPLASTTSPAR